MKKLIVSLALVACLNTQGCQNAAEAEAVVHGTLIGISLGGDWLQAHKDTVDWAFDIAIKYAAGNPSLQARLIEAKAAFDAGDLATAQTGLAVGIAATAPIK